MAKWESGSRFRTKVLSVSPLLDYHRRCEIRWTYSQIHVLSESGGRVEPWKCEVWVFSFSQVATDLWEPVRFSRQETSEMVCLWPSENSAWVWQTLKSPVLMNKTSAVPLCGIFLILLFFFTCYFQKEDTLMYLCLDREFALGSFLKSWA